MITRFVPVVVFSLLLSACDFNLIGDYSKYKDKYYQLKESHEELLVELNKNKAKIKTLESQLNTASNNQDKINAINKHETLLRSMLTLSEPTSIVDYQ